MSSNGRSFTEIDMDPEQQLYTPKIVDIAAVIEMHGTSEALHWKRQQQQQQLFTQDSFYISFVFPSTHGTGYDHRGLSTLSRGSTLEKLQWTFNLYDINGDGRVSKDEMFEITNAIYCLLGRFIEPEVDEESTRDHAERVFQGTMTAQRYVDDVLRPVTLPYLQGIPNAVYQQDNARPHTARISQQALQDVQMLPWPPYSSDRSPIEHVWDIIGRRLHALPQPRSEDELWQMVEREWRAIPQDAIRTLIDSLPRRVAACIAVRGGPTCY
ncbi:KCNIP4 [Cordylochernes scorpioides]|uniref:KCNIP4 n=1 Tax=Cordylochernes scorpioides TaxID=51811 RepID=A0ABY6L4L7_9ARAC|nr:KCNIP4 [Cordylochernes scorpioides]